MCRYLATPKNTVSRTMALLAVVIAFALAIGAASQVAVAQDDVYAVGYFANARVGGAPDAQLRLTNDGYTESNLWADIYVFNNDEQMEECCSCEVTPDGYLDLDVNKDLYDNLVTPERFTYSGIIKVISSSVPGPTTPTPTIGIRGWQTRIQNGATSGTYSITEGDLKDSVLSASEESSLAETCSFVLSLGSGAGACSCSPAGH